MKDNPRGNICTVRKEIPFPSDFLLKLQGVYPSERDRLRDCERASDAGEGKGKEKSCAYSVMLGESERLSQPSVHEAANKYLLSHECFLTIVVSLLLLSCNTVYFVQL
jgi:hypothetical protein